MSSTVTTRAACSASARTTGGSDTISANLALESSPCRSQRIGRDLLIDMNGLGMLTEVIESGKPAIAVALKGTLARMFPYMAS